MVSSSLIPSPQHNWGQKLKEHRGLMLPFSLGHPHLLKYSDLLPNSLGVCTRHRGHPLPGTPVVGPTTQMRSAPQCPQTPKAKGLITPDLMTGYSPPSARGPEADTLASNPGKLDRGTGSVHFSCLCGVCRRGGQKAGWCMGQW